MFYTFSKILNSNPAQLGLIMVQGSSIFYINEDTLENKQLQTSYVATRIEISSFPNYSFHTTTPMTTVLGLLEGVVDARAGAPGPGSQCAGTPGVIDFVYPIASYPFVRANMLVNTSRSLLQEYVFNPNYLVFAEDTPFRDSKTGVQDSALMIVLRDSQPKKTLTDLSFADLSAIIEPTIIPA